MKENVMLALFRILNLAFPLKAHKFSKLRITVKYGFLIVPLNKGMQDLIVENNFMP
jgi:hypothetical protein